MIKGSNYNTASDQTNLIIQDTAGPNQDSGLMITVNKYRLESCVWEITLACCFSCAYCGSKAGKARKGELNTQECLSVVSQLADLGCRRVNLIGGEVFLRPDWKCIVQALTQHGIRVSIITNGFIFTESLIRDLKDVRVESVAISLDGPETIHDRFRQKGSFQRGIRAMDTLIQQGIPVSVITTLHGENVSHLEEMYSILKEKKIAAWQLQACSPMGNVLQSGMDWRINFKEVVQFVTDHLPEDPWMFGIADNIGYFTEEEGFLRGNLSGEAVFCGCQAGLSAIGIDSTGNVRGCESMYDERFNEGNLRSKTLREIWEDPDAFAYNRKFKPELLEGKCAHCIHGPFCAAGCRSYNYFSHKKLYEAYQCAGFCGHD